jgi:hypothetical protein
MTSRTVRPAPWRAVLVGLAATVTLTATLGACSGSDETSNASDEPTVETTTPTPTSETPTPTPTPTATASTESPAPTLTASPTESATEPAGPDPTTRLLPARSVGGLNDQWRWRAGETRSSEPDQVADCLRFSLSSIGASRVASRTYGPPASSSDARTSAVQVVAEAPDQETAVRMMQVLRSWQAGCQKRLNNSSDQPHRVSEPDVLDAGDEAFAYLHSTPGSTPDTTLFQDIGQVRVGRLVSVVVVRLDEMDYNYEPQRTPAALSLAAAAARLG